MKKRSKSAFSLYSFSWCTIEYVKITLPDDPEAYIKETRELLDSKTDAEESSI